MTSEAAARGCLIDSTRELSGTVFGLSAIFVILRLVRRPYGLHAIGPQDHAIIQTHASHKACGPIAKTTSSSIPMPQPLEPGGPNHRDGGGPADRITACHDLE
jgi:hypothetical protein